MQRPQMQPYGAGAGQSIGGGGFQPYAAGAKHYGGGRSFPTSGSVNGLGYAQRDRQTATRRNAMLRQLQARQGGNFGSADALRPLGR